MITITSRSFIVSLLSILCVIVFQALSLDTTLDSMEVSKRISTIKIVGNDRTKERIVRLYLMLDTGMVYDSVAVEEARQRLLSSKLFSKVAILKIDKPMGKNLFVVLTEKPPLSLSNIGGTWYSKRYGTDPPSFWKSWSISLGIQNANFRGTNEVLRIGVEFWEWRGFGISWKKPLLPGPWYISVGFGLANYPYEYRARRIQRVSLRATAGRKTFENSYGYLSLVPRYTAYTYKGPADSPPEADTNDAALGLWEADQSVHRLREILYRGGHVIDRTNDTYPKSKGWYNWTQVLMNMPSEQSSQATTYFQFDNQFRLYHPFFLSDHSFAHRVQLSLRSKEGGDAHRIVAGDNNSLRGYGSGYFGTFSNANNRLLLTSEYRFKIVQTPELPLLPLVGIVYGNRPSIIYRIDGSLFTDAGVLWHRWSDNPFRKKLVRRERGWSGGFGLKLTSPQLKVSACIDFVPVMWIDRGNYWWSFDFSRWAGDIRKKKNVRHILPFTSYLHYNF